MKSLFTTCLLLLLALRAAAQLTVIGNVSDTVLMNLFAGSGITATNPHYTGDAWASGFFYGTTSLPYNNGILLTTGTAAIAAHANDTTNAGTDLHLPGDTDLSVMIGFSTFDASILEFDYIPLYDNIHFNFVFASEEYPEYVAGSSRYFDLAAVLISGPAPGGGSYDKLNIATVPGTTISVGVSTVNDGYQNGGPCKFCTLYVNNTGGQDIQYDGYTKDLSGSAHVIPGSSYHIKVSIADVSDHIYDSGVFLKQHSFRSEGPLGVEELSQASADIYPNPVSDQFYIRSKEEITRCLIYDLTGRIVKNSEEAGISSVSLAGLQSGTYIAEIYTAKGRAVKRIVKE